MARGQHAHAEAEPEDPEVEVEAGEGLAYEDGDGFTFDMSAANEKEGSLEPMPQGIYECTIEEAEYKLSNASGKPMWSLKLAVVGPAAWAELNRKLFYNISFADNMIGRAKAAILKFAPDLAELKNFNPKKIADEGVLLGRSMRVKVKIGTYEGQKRNEVKDVLPPAPGGASGFGL